MVKKLSMSSNAKPEDVSKAATARWFAKTAQEIQNDYDRLHAEARCDPQKAGHEAEAGWKAVLDRWVPPHYEVGTRKYLLPDINPDGADAPTIRD